MKELIGRRTRLIRGYSSEVIKKETRFIALGNFDGLHRGHQQLLRALKESAGNHPGAICSVMSFYPHPAVVLGKVSKRPPLATLRQRIAILSELGFDELIMQHFTKAFSQLSAADFVSDILIKKLNLHTLFVGPDAAIGQGREAQVDVMATLLKDHGVSLIVLPHLIEGGKKIGTRAIREALAGGELLIANDALGVPFALSGRVIRGEGRGKGIAIPTANISTKQLLPKYGVYGGLVRFGSELHQAVINIGARPTFNGKDVSVEAHLYDYQGGDFYGQRITAELHTHIRDEKRFAGPSELVSQIHLDIEQTRQRFKLSKI